MKFISKNKKMLIFVFIPIIIYMSGCSNNFATGDNYINSYFFKPEQISIEYEGFFLPLSCTEIQQDIILNIIEISTFEDGTLFALELDQLDVMDPLDEISMGGRYLGYFYVMDDTIYRMRLLSFDGFTDEKTEEIIALIEKDQESFFNECDIVCSESGTDDIPDENGWHTYVEVDGDRRVFNMYNEYVSGTKEYEQIIWEKGKGITYYKHGSGSMLMHIEFGLNLYENIEEGSY